MDIGVYECLKTDCSIVGIWYLANCPETWTGVLGQRVEVETRDRGVDKVSEELDRTSISWAMSIERRS